MLHGQLQRGEITQEEYDEAVAGMDYGVEGVEYSISRIIGDNGKDYGIGVRLDSVLLENLTPEERIQMVKLRVEELGGQNFTAYDQDGNPVESRIAEKGEKFKNKRGRYVSVNKDLATKYNKNAVKQESVVLADELIQTAEYSENSDAKYSHGWLDDNGKNKWEKWKTFVQDKNNAVWEATLHIANSANGEKILYDIDQIKKAEQSGTSDKSTAKNIIRTSLQESQERNSVKRQFSIGSVDSEGRKLSAEQREYFKDSKAVDENGNLKMMYRGGNETFTVFDRRKSKPSNLYGRGFYFTESPDHAAQYGEIRPYYLNITNPLTTDQHKITRQQMRAFLEAVAENEDYGLENYGYGATVDSVLKSIYGKGDFEMLQDVNATAIGDLVAAAELFNEVNGTDYDGVILPTETVTFRSNQAKEPGNRTPTENPDIQFSFTGITSNGIEAYETSEEVRQMLYKLTDGCMT